MKNCQSSSPFLDFSGENNPRQSALTFLQQEFILPFDLYEKPLFKYTFKKSDNCFFCFEKYHHLIVDGWSIALITQSLAVMYTHISQGQPVQIAAIPSYLPFVNNDRAYIESSLDQIHRQYGLEKYQTLPKPWFAPRYSSGREVDQILPSEYRVLSLARPFYNRLIALANFLVMESKL